MTVNYSNYTDEQLHEQFKELTKVVPGITDKNVVDFVGNWKKTEYGESEEFLKDSKDLVKIDGDKVQLRPVKYDYHIYRGGQLMTMGSTYNSEIEMLTALKDALDKVGYYNSTIIQRQKFTGMGTTKIIAMKII